MYKLIFFVPDSHVERVKEAIFSAGAGQLGDYESCSWQVLGTGQFKPVSGAAPFIGEIDSLSRVEEWRVETLCSAAKVKAVVAALKQSHPYEEVAFELVQIVDPDLLT